MYELPLLPIGEHTAKITVFTPEDAELHELDSWSLKPLQREEDVASNPSLAKALARELCELGIKEAFAPHVAPASGNIVRTRDLTDQIRWRETTLHRNHRLPADGVFLHPRQAFVMSGAGCPIVLASAKKYFIATHAGRDSLIDRGAVTHAPTRDNVSVVETVIEEFLKLGISREEVTMIMMFSIPAKEFEHDEEHPEYGDYNSALASLVERRWPGGIVREGTKTFLDLENVFVEQALHAGIRKVWAIHSLANYPLAAHTRDGKGERRNLIVVKHDS